MCFLFPSPNYGTSFTLYKYGEQVLYGEENNGFSDMILTSQQTTREGMWAWLEYQTRSEVVILETLDQAESFLITHESAVLSYFEVFLQSI